jgi:uncharacterized membrane protein
MRTHFASRWDKLKGGFWFIPAIFIFVGIALANVMIEIDRAIQAWSTQHLIWIFSGNQEWAKQILTTMGASMVAGIALIVSVTIVALSLASQQFGPRLLRNFLRDTTTKFILGTYFATAVYGMVIRFRFSESFIPYLSIIIGGFLAIFTGILLIVFIHHISTAIHVSHVMALVSRDFSRTVERLFPKKLLEQSSALATPSEKDIPADFDKDSFPIPSVTSGYIQHIDYEYLIDLSQKMDLHFKIPFRPGEFIVQGVPLAFVWPKEKVKNSIAHKINKAIYLGYERTLTQDVEFAINQLVEIAVRAMSPAINDPFTAIRCLNRLGQGLVELAQVQMPSPYLYDSKKHLRLIIKTITFPKVVNAAFNLIRQNALTSPPVMIALLKSIGVVAQFVNEPEDLAILRLHAEMVNRGCEKSLHENFDMKQVHAIFEETMKRL